MSNRLQKPFMVCRDMLGQDWHRLGWIEPASVRSFALQLQLCLDRDRPAWIAAHQDRSIYAMQPPVVSTTWTEEERLNLAFWMAVELEKASQGTWIDAEQVYRFISLLGHVLTNLPAWLNERRAEILASNIEHF